MTTQLTPPVRGFSTPSVRELARIETVRSLRRASIWIGFVLTIAILSSTSVDWPSGSYTEHLPQGFMPIVLGTLIASFRTGRRDAEHDVSESAPIDIDQRTLARLCSIAVPAALTTVLVVGLAVVSRIEGGFWIGEGTRRTDTALHTPGELIQMPLIVALVGVLGIALGRSRPKRAMISVLIAGALVFTMFPGYWIWNTPPAYVVAPVQSQPLYIDLEPGTTIEATPEDWLVEEADPGEVPVRQLVHQPTALAHDVYLLGLVVLVAGFASRGSRGRRAKLGGAALAVGGVLVQLLVSPL